MTSAGLVLRTVYVDLDVDDHLREEALVQHSSKAALFRKYLAAGMKSVRAQSDLLKTPDLPAAPLVLRTVHLDAKLDSKLQVTAFDNHISKADLVRRYVRLGIASLHRG